MTFLLIMIPQRSSIKCCMTIFHIHSSFVVMFRRTPLMLAVFRGHVETTSFLISAGANIHAVDIYHRTSIHMAVSER